MSEATINRYEQGGLQDDAHDSMIRLASEPTAIAALLEQSGDRLGPQQNESLLRAIRNALVHTTHLSLRRPPQSSEETGGRDFDFWRLANLVTWWCAEVGEVDEPDLDWLVFTSDALSYRRLGHSLTGACYVNRRFGPQLLDAGRLEERLDEEGVAERHIRWLPNQSCVYTWRQSCNAPKQRFSVAEENVLRFIAEFRAKSPPRFVLKLDELYQTHCVTGEAPALISFSKTNRLADAIEQQNR